MEKPNNPTRPNSPPKQGRISLGDSKIHFNNTFVGTTDPTYNGGFTSRLSMNNYINEIPNQRNNISKEVITIIIQNIISSAVTFL